MRNLGESGVITTPFEFGEQSGLQAKAIRIKTEGAEQQPDILELLVHIPELVEIEPDLAHWWPGEGKGEKDDYLDCLKCRLVSDKKGRVTQIQILRPY